jgi:hypothetical protein
LPPGENDMTYIKKLKRDVIKIIQSKIPGAVVYIGLVLIGTINGWVLNAARSYITFDHRINANTAEIDELKIEATEQYESIEEDVELVKKETKEINTKLDTLILSLIK